MGWGWALINFAAFRMGAYSRWALIRGWALIRRNTVFNTFGALLLISRNGFGSTNFSTAFRLQNFFFSCFFLLFFLCHFLLYFLDLFFVSLPSLTHLSPPHCAPSAPDKKERPFCFAPDHYLDYSAFLAYAKSTGCFVA